MKHLITFLLKIVERVGRLTKTDSIYLAKGVSWLSLNKVVASTSAFLLSLVWASQVPKEIYGEYKYFLAMLGIASIFSLNGLGTATTRGVGIFGHGASSNSLLERATKMKLTWSLGGSTCALIAFLVYLVRGDYLTGAAALTIAIALPALQGFTLYAAYLNGLSAFKTLSKISSILTIGVSLFTAGLVIFAPHQPLIYLIGYVVANSLGNILAFIYTKQTYKSKNLQESVTLSAQDRGEIAKTLSYGKHVSAMEAISVAVNYLDSFFLFHFLSPAQLAIYAFAQAIPNQFKGIFKFIPTLALPKLATYDVSTTIKTLPRKLGILLGIGFIMSVGYYIISPFIFEWFYPSYQESIGASRLFALSFFIGPAAAYAGTVLSAHRAIKGQYINTLIPDLTFVVSAIFLTPRIGIYGIVSAKLIAYTTGFIISLVWIAHTALRHSQQTSNSAR